MALLRAKLYDRELERQQKELYEQRKMQVGSGSRSEKIRTYNYKDNRCTDHRLNLNFPLQSILKGEMFGMHDKYIAKAKEESLLHGS